AARTRIAWLARRTSVRDQLPRGRHRPNGPRGLSILAAVHQPYRARHRPKDSARETHFENVHAMSETTILWIFGIVITVLIAVVGGGLASHIGVIQRLTKVETLFEIVGGNMLKALHCPNDTHGFD